MKIIGITGGIGSGKSTVTNILKEYFNAYIIYTDQVAHDLMKKGMISYQLIVNYFGNGILDSFGEIDRNLLGRMVYNNQENLLRLNSFTHPYVMEEVHKVIDVKTNENYDLICVETALPKEAGLKKFCDEIWYIYATENVRRERLQQGRNYSDEKMNQIFSKQISEEDYKKISTHTINNNGSMEKVIEQIEVILVKKANL